VNEKFSEMQGTVSVVETMQRNQPRAMLFFKSRQGADGSYLGAVGIMMPPGASYPTAKRRNCASLVHAN
jgi:hypothetical protein